MPERKTTLLKSCRSILDRRIETSVELANPLSAEVWGATLPRHSTIT